MFCIYVSNEPRERERGAQDWSLHPLHPSHVQCTRRATTPVTRRLCARYTPVNTPITQPLHIGTRALYARYTSVTRPCHVGHTSVTRLLQVPTIPGPLHVRYRSVTRQSHARYTSTTSPVHDRNMSITRQLHFGYRSFVTRQLHEHYTSATRPLQARYKSVTRPLQPLHVRLHVR